MSMLSWLLSRSRHDDRGDHQQMKKMVERVVGMSPPLRLAQNYEARLLPALTEAMRYIERLTAEVPAAREATAAAWSSDPCIHAFFAAPQDVCAALSQSEHLRSYFSAHAESVEAFAVLGMAMDQRHVFGVAQHGVVTRSDVAQTTVSFSDHQVRVCSATDAELRQQIMLRLLDQLTLQGLQKIETDESRRDALEEERALLRARLALLERQAAGVRSLLGSKAPPSVGEMARAQAQLDRNEQELAHLGLKTETIERGLSVICEVLSSPEPYLCVQQKKLRLDPMNIVADGTDGREANEVEFTVVQLPESADLTRAFALLRFKRSDLLAERDMFAEARRLLI
ncbi:hypothetical protein [Paraburkholderia kirstenboschensis]|uniref:Uncharacterized protein n=1 Tax=Paraburkholderia kirstenboschensis TaxID=1245436 RepID=A0ABZ0EGD5_9BURK|nr:hypothetical protein [Paraburkholderia kirstenboschensis]WOD16278.1 hypothetical protein RW095_10140 [Paraburkholderia kirstenboschensis]